MVIRSCLFAALLACGAAASMAQQVPAPPLGWRNPRPEAQPMPPANSALPGRDLRPVNPNNPVMPVSAVMNPPSSVPTASPTATASPPPAAPRRPIAKYTEGASSLPNGHGQVWREYDISPYTVRVNTTSRPEQAIVDWILRETGYEAWHGEPLGILSATKRTLRVYHTPEMQAVVADVVDRFVNSEAETNAFELRVVALEQPNWRIRAQRLLRPVSASTPGVQAWLLKKEDTAMLLADLRRRSDYRELNRPQLFVQNGQSVGISLTRPRPYVRDVLLRNDPMAGFDPQGGQIDEGFTLEFSPLLSADARIIDATIKCDMDQLEKLIPVVLDTPAAGGPRQRAQIDVPQIVRSRFHERFRWPVEQVLLVDLGMAPLPPGIDGKPGSGLLALSGPSTRANVLIFLESRGNVAVPAKPGAKPELEASRIMRNNRY